MMDSDAILGEALDTWGLEMQALVLIEEMAELTQAIIKSRRDGCIKITPQIIEELADVNILCRQIMLAMDDDQSTNYYSVYVSKLERLRDIFDETDDYLEGDNVNDP